MLLSQALRIHHRRRDLLLDRDLRLDRHLHGSLEDDLGVDRDDLVDVHVERDGRFAELAQPGDRLVDSGFDLRRQLDELLLEPGDL